MTKPNKRYRKKEKNMTKKKKFHAFEIEPLCNKKCLFIKKKEKEKVQLLQKAGLTSLSAYHDFCFSSEAKGASC